jgi:hypothetical protein
MDEEVEERFTERARTRLADTLSEAARMLTAPPSGDPLPGPADRPGRGFDDVLLSRPVSPRLGLDSDADGPARDEGTDEIEQLRAEADRLRAENEHLLRRAEVAEAKAEEREAALEDLRRALQQRPEAPQRTALSLIDPVLTFSPPTRQPAQPAPAGAPEERAPPPAPEDGYTWAFTRTPRRRFWRRR